MKELGQKWEIMEVFIFPSPNHNTDSMSEFSFESVDNIADDKWQKLSVTSYQKVTDNSLKLIILKSVKASMEWVTVCFYFINSYILLIYE